MGGTRFFVADLPPGVTEKQLTKLFKGYGSVERVELKTKDNPFEPDSVKVIAFVTVQIHQNDVNNCIDSLNWEKINGTKIKVSVAKESFLERLKREREEAEKVTNGDDIEPRREVQADDVFPRSAENTRKVFTEEELTALENDDAIPADLMISKKRAANSLLNGRIVIQSFDKAPLHVIEGDKKKKKKTDGKEITVAEQKRKESQNKMTKQYKDKKSVIQHALAGLDAPQSKKIKFSDAEEDSEDERAEYKSNQKSKTNIFGSDDEEGERKFKLKPELFGKKGAKLVEMQSKQSLDPRFRIDAKFIEGDENEEDEEPLTNADANGEHNAVSERNWQMNILEQVVGTKLDKADGTQKAARKKRMLRYDPSNEEHQKLLRTTNKETEVADAEPTMQEKKKQKEKKQKEVNPKSSTPNVAPEVSKEVFYVVTDTLAESLKTRGEGFSLLQMFGNSQSQDKRADELKKVADSKILVNKLDKKVLNPFKYDSSSDEEVEGSASKQQTGAHEKKKSKQQNKIIVESFFIPRNDARLKEGAKFFRYEKKKDAPEEDYEAVRNRLKLLIRSKINKTKKNILANSGGRTIGHKRRIKGRY